MGIKERREREKNKLRTKILDASRELLAKEGFEAFTMRKLAEHIEYSATAIYLHFKDKESLVTELCVMDIGEMEQTFKKAAQQIEDPIERVRGMSKVFVNFALSHQTQYRVIFMMPKPYNKDEDPTALASYDLAYQNLKLTFEELIAKGLLKKEFQDPDLAAQTYFCGLHGIVSLQISSCKRLPSYWTSPLSQAEFLINSLLNGVLK